MMYCPNCTQENPDNKHRCYICGSNLAIINKTTDSNSSNDLIAIEGQNKEEDGHSGKGSGLLILGLFMLVGLAWGFYGGKLTFVPFFAAFFIYLSCSLTAKLDNIKSLKLAFSLHGGLVVYFFLILIISRDEMVLVDTTLNGIGLLLLFIRPGLISVFYLTAIYASSFYRAVIIINSMPMPFVDANIYGDLTVAIVIRIVALVFLYKGLFKLKGRLNKE